MNNHAGLTLTRPTTGTMFSHINARLPQGKGCLGYPRPHNWALNVHGIDFLSKVIGFNMLRMSSLHHFNYTETYA